MSIVLLTMWNRNAQQIIDKRQQGFTLIELLVVIAIIGLLASIALASLDSARTRGRIAAGMQFASHISRTNADLILRYDLNEGTGTQATDASGSGYTGAISGAVWSGDAVADVLGDGANQSSLLFDGGDRVTTTLRRNFNGARTDITVSVWYRYTGSATRTYSAIIGALGGADFFIGKNTGNTNIGVQDGNYLSSMAVGTNAWDGEWHHIAYTYDGSTQRGKLFLDGNKVGENTFTGGVAAAILVGYEVEGVGYGFVGNIDSVEIFSSALEIAQVESLYYAHAPKYIALNDSVDN